MRARFAIVVVILQVSVLAYMAGERELVLRQGRSVWLRTAPVDPRDPMRGDYVRFNYEIAEVPRRLCRGEITGWFTSDWESNQRVRDRRVYAEVQPDEEGVAQLVSLSDQRPAHGNFIRGRVASIAAHHVRVRFGVEALFMEQGKARALETEQQQREGVPLNIEAAVSDGGLAVTRGYRWEPLGITVEFDRPEQPAGGSNNLAGQRRGIVGATIKLKNHGERPVGIVARPQGRSFRLVPEDEHATTDYRWVSEDELLPAPAPAMIKVLQPGEAHEEHLDFRDRYRWVVETKRGEPPRQPQSLESLGEAWSTWFRLVYIPPPRVALVGMPNAELVRHSTLKSRRFFPAGGVD